MGVKLDQVVPWGRSLAEYQAMFALTADDLVGPVLDCGGGPASFNAELTQQGYQVVSCDPLYRFTPDEIARRIADTYPVVIAGVEATHDTYCWTTIASPEELGRTRLASMATFLVDFRASQSTGRYIAGALPDLPFRDGQFVLALCSHFLFTYSDQFSTEFHLAALEELCRVAREVCVFPLLATTSELSPHLEPVIGALQRRDYAVAVETVDYEFQRGGNQLLRVSAPQRASQPAASCPRLSIGPRASVQGGNESMKLRP